MTFRSSQMFCSYEYICSTYFWYLFFIFIHFVQGGLSGYAQVMQPAVFRRKRFSYFQSMTRMVQHQNVPILPPHRFNRIFFTVSSTYDCPVSRYTVQDKPLFVITTIQNRISQTVFTSIEHTIELDIWTKIRNPFFVDTSCR